MTQDDSREIKVWKASDISTPIIKTIGRSYNPVWYVQSLAEFELESYKDPLVLSTSGTDSKINLHRIDIGRREIQQVQTAVAKALPTAVLPLNNQYFAAASSSEIEFFDALTGLSVNSVQTSSLSPQSAYYGLDTILSLTLIYY